MRSSIDFLHRHNSLEITERPVRLAQCHISHPQAPHSSASQAASRDILHSIMNLSFRHRIVYDREIHILRDKRNLNLAKGLPD